MSSIEEIFQDTNNSTSEATPSLRGIGMELERLFIEHDHEKYPIKAKQKLNKTKLNILSESTIIETSQTTDEENEEILTSISQILYWKIFLLFLKFGIHAWGGTAAKVARFKEDFVYKQHWISENHFKRVYTV
ncbi:hypothetical protein G9A89_003502 [Geosiphon pyriformis]|nr:hypothetical protein G9A89_003502 [Geosiphon pyriformis]